MTTTTKPRNARHLLLLGTAFCSLSLMAAPAYGQVADEDAVIETTATVPEVQEEDVVVVTGSRIKRNGYDTPSPVSILDETLIEESGFANLGDVLARAPAIAVGQGLSNAQTSGLDSGATFANLRGLGSFRTLTLVNGRRRVPGDFTSSSVDLGAIPPSMVARTEIVTGGTSAVYGADAVTGVINVILKKDFEGLTIEGSAGVPDAGGGGSAQQLSLTYGKNFDNDRGNISFGGNYYNSELLMSREREFSSGNNFIFFQTNVPGDTFNGVTPQFTVRQNPTTFLFAETGTFFFFNNDPNVFAFEIFTADPDIRPQVSDIPPFTNQFNAIQGNGWGTGGDGFNFAKYGQLRGGYEAFNGMVNLNYELSDQVEMYANFDITSSETESPGQPNFHPADGIFLRVTRDNPLIPTGVGQFMDDNFFGTLFVRRTHDDIGVRTTFVDRLNYTGVGGLKGNLANGWDFDLFAQYGEMNIDTTTTNTMISQNFVNAVDVISDPVSGAPICRSATARADGCQPFSILGRNDNISQATRDYFLHDFETSLDLTQVILGAQMTGDVYELPAGMVGFAAGVEYREETLHFQDDPRNTAGEILLNAPTPETRGKIDVAEIFGEVVVPVLADKPFVQNLQVEGAVRISDYSQTETSTTWKLGGNWQVNDDLKFRVTRSLSVRAPTITDLFSPGITSFQAVTDPCDQIVIDLLVDAGQAARRRTNCAALGLDPTYNDPFPTVTKQVLTGGNLDLEPEDSYSWTIGGILTPSFVEGLRVSVDYWDIDLSNVITAQGSTAILNNCVDSATINNEFCALVTRGAIDPADPSSGSVLSVRDFRINIDETRTKGVDFQLNYDFDPSFVPGNFEFYGAATLLTDYTITQVSPLGNTTTDEKGEVIGTPLPEWRANVSLAYNQGPVRVSWFGNYIDSMVVSKNEAPGTYQPGFDTIDSVFYHYLYAKYDINDKFMVQGGINNVLDKAPPANPFTFQGAGGLYDNNGRYFWIGGRAKF